jgi:hypothetical protein
MPIKNKTRRPAPSKPRQKVNLNLSDETKSFQEKQEQVAN